MRSVCWLQHTGLPFRRWILPPTPQHGSGSAFNTTVPTDTVQPLPACRGLRFTAAPRIRLVLPCGSALPLCRFYTVCRTRFALRAVTVYRGSPGLPYRSLPRARFYGSPPAYGSRYAVHLPAVIPDNIGSFAAVIAMRSGLFAFDYLDLVWFYLTVHHVLVAVTAATQNTDTCLVTVPCRLPACLPGCHHALRLPATCGTGFTGFLRTATAVCGLPAAFRPFRLPPRFHCLFLTFYLFLCCCLRFTHYRHTCTYLTAVFTAYLPGFVRAAVYWF